MSNPMKKVYRDAYIVAFQCKQGATLCVFHSTETARNEQQAEQLARESCSAVFPDAEIIQVLSVSRIGL